MRLRGLSCVFFCLGFVFLLGGEAPAMVFMVNEEEKKGEEPAVVEVSEEKEPEEKFERAEGDYFSLSPDDLNKIRDYVEALPGWEDARITKALAKLEKGMSWRGKQDCSQGVRKAIMAERGIDIFRSARPRELVTANGRVAATGYGMERMLKRHGYRKVASRADYTPQRGDVQSIFYGKEIDGYAGHVQYYDGERWISDHKQRTSAADPEVLRAQGVDPGRVRVQTYRKKS